VLELQGKLTLLDQNRHSSHPAFRRVLTTNTVGLGDTTGLYHGTSRSTRADGRWSIVRR